MSEGLSERTKKFNEEGNHFTDDSRHSEKVLTDAIEQDIIPLTDELIKELFGEGFSLRIMKRMNISELKRIQKEVYPDAPEPSLQDEKTFITPDGGVWFLQSPDERLFPLMIIEDKKQGTNDKLFSEGKKKQSLGNAIERYAKNVRASEMLFSGESIFPYVLFGSGCDFHSSETIPNRISSSNYGYPNHYIDVNPEKTDDSFNEELDMILSSINIDKKLGRNCVIQAFIKAHKYDEMVHGASDWKKEEIKGICCHIIKQSLDYYLHKYFSE